MKSGGNRPDLNWILQFLLIKSWLNTKEEQVAAYTLHTVCPGSYDQENVMSFLFQGSAPPEKKFNICASEN